MVCPEDGEKVSLKDASFNNFPKNIALMKIIEMKKSSTGEKDSSLEMSKIVQNEEQQEDEDTRDLVASIISPNNTVYFHFYLEAKKTSKSKIRMKKILTKINRMSQNRKWHIRHKK